MIRTCDLRNGQGRSHLLIQHGLERESIACRTWLLSAAKKWSKKRKKKNRRDVKLRKKHHSDSLNFARWRRGSSDTGMPAVQRICSRMASRKGLGRMSRPDVEQAARSDSLQCLGKAAHKMLESWCPHIQNRLSEY